jgi:hypothetical protein
MTISPPLVPDDEQFNKLANRLARELSTAFGYSLEESETHIRNFFNEYEKSIPERARSLREAGVTREFDWTTVDLFFHEDSALVLYIGYQLAGGDPTSLKYLDWRKNCWDPLKLGERVPLPQIE